MKLGKDTGSVMNHIMSGNRTAPEKNGLATQLMWSDRYPFLVKEVSEDKTRIVIQAFKPKPYNPHSEDTVRFAPEDETEGPEMVVVLRKRRGGGQPQWKVVCEKFILEESFRAKYENNTTEMYAKLRELGVFDEYYEITKAVDGVSKKKVTYSPISLSFGFAEQFRDPSF
jgi:hypothetical protein